MQNNNQNQQVCYEEDEIDLRELFKTIWNSKKLIIAVTTIITLLAGVYAFTKTPIYEVKSNVQIGYIGQELIVKQDNLVNILRAIFHVDEKKKI